MCSAWFCTTPKSTVSVNIFKQILSSVSRGSFSACLLSELRRIAVSFSSSRSELQDNYSFYINSYVPNITVAIK